MPESRNRGAGAEPYKELEMPVEEQKKLYEETKRKIRAHNRKARLENPVWKIVQRTQNNDSAYEDKELRFKEKDEKNKRDENRDTDRYQNIQNIANRGSQLGYTDKQYKHVMSRFIYHGSTPS
jgi:hypothetical protein